MSHSRLPILTPRTYGKTEAGNYVPCLSPE